LEVLIMKLDLDFLLLCVYAQDKKILKLAFFPPKSPKYPKITQKLSNSSDLTLI